MVNTLSYMEISLLAEGGLLGFVPLFWLGMVLLVAINCVTLLCYAVDKWRAVHSGWRIPEPALLALALAGGSPAACLAILLFRHKIRKPVFLILLLLILVLQATVFWYCAENGWLA